MQEQELVLRQFQALFQGHAQYYGRYPLKGETFTDGKPMIPWTEKKRPLEDKTWIAHLSGQGLGLGITPVMEDSTAVFGAIDYDTKPNEADLVDLNSRIQSNALPLVICRSKSGGAHFYLFSKEPVPAKLMRDRLREYAMVLGIYLNPNGHPVEIFPKQGRVDENAQGNWINLPYYEAKTTNRYALAADGSRLDLREFLSYANKRMVTREQLDVTTFTVESKLHPEAPPCLQVLDRDGYPQGTRNDGLMNVGLLLEKVDPERWEQNLREYNHDRFNPPLNDHEVEGIIKSLRRDFTGSRKYTYGCNKPPINHLCNRDLCKKLTYGIDSFDVAACTTIDKLIKVDVDPPRWLAYVDGQPVDVSTEQLLDPKQFKRRALDVLNRIIKIGTLAAWEKMVSNLLERLDVIEAPEDAGVFGQFKSHVRAFVEKRSENDLSDTLRGFPVEYEGWVWFRSEALMKHLERSRFRDYKVNEIYNAIRRMGGEHYQGKLPKMRQTVNLWKLPIPTADDEQTEPFELPPENTHVF